ncbi:hypothetical protein [Mariniphaga sp.]|uniref:hypothetical protein n=1 Tax=Mariniphaga sp. TaxID=1954475 RepID=UPI0035626BF4
MKDAIKYIFSSLMPSKDDGSYIELDKNMKSQMKLFGIISLFIFIIIVGITIYFYLKTPIVVNIINRTKDIIVDEIIESGDFPQWIIKIFLLSIFIIIVFTLVFFYFLIDLSKVHYKLDKITFKVIKKLNLTLYQKTIEYLNCTNHTSCIIRNKLNDAVYQRKFRNDFFYFFTNKDEIGAFNQKDKRRHVFKEWSKYYTFNFVFIFLILISLWIGYLIIILNPNNLGWKIPIYIFSLVIIIYKYKKIGSKYRTLLIDLAIDQLNIIFTEVRNDAFRKLKDVFGNCFENGCNFNQSV